MIAFTMVSCTSLQPSTFSAGRPFFDPIKFFAGKTSSSGVMENRRGVPMQVVTTKTSGKVTGDILKVEQSIVLGNSPPQYRSWKLRKVDSHHYEATANDIVGIARGEAYGNTFHWIFTLALTPGNPLKNITMSQWMYLQPDGRTMINHSTLSKFGIVVAQVTEQFRRAE